ncbi:sugar ABC transporter permease [Streptomyces sp. NBC_01361]|nr:sugar ABC transporter permease [Streptomyces sp. NBC_01361]
MSRLTAEPAVTTAAPSDSPSDNMAKGAATSRGILSHWRLYAAISPFYLLFLCFGLVPVGFSLFVAFQRWDGLGHMEYAGLSQFRYLLSDTQFWDSLGNTLIIWALGTFPMLFLALVAAVMLNSAVRFKSVYRFAYFLPNVTSIVAVSIVFGSIFSTNFGLVNGLLQMVGLDQIPWLNDPWGIKISIAALMTWQWVGYNAIIFLAGLQTIPGELYEAAKVDGAGPVHTFFKVTVPMIRPVILFTVVVSTITGMQSFTESQVLLSANNGGSTFAGGPEHAGQTMVLYFYQQTFDNNDFGYGAAIAWAIFLVVAVFAVINWRLVQRREKD